MAPWRSACAIQAYQEACGREKELPNSQATHTKGQAGFSMPM